MVIELFKLKAQGKTESPFSFTFEPKKSLLDLPNAEFKSGATISGIVEIYPDKAFVVGKLHFAIKGECSRCLSPAEKEITVEFDEEFRPAPCGDENVNVYEKGVIKLDDLIEQLILTNLPLTILCKEDCKGLCHTCGKNLNEGECGHNKN